MEKVVVDASVVVKWYINEDYSENARELRNMYINGQIELIAPELLPYEVLNALKYSNYFKKEELVQIAKSLTFYGFILFPLTGKLAEKTVEIAVSKDVNDL